ncbi:MAG TPA: hypothetical protein ENK18_21570 [Deltaproteobacteria bacterium]|nr:hypothetical protein [Deltaproteobacteria bacterium]
MFGFVIFSLVSGAQPPVTAVMHERYALLTEARDRIIAGDLAGARDAGQQLAGIEEISGIPGGWEQWLDPLRIEARALGRARDLSSAAAGVGRIAGVCADCHGATQGGPGLEGARDVPPQSWSEGQNMSLHRWATDWMWLGLLAADEGAWRRGAGELDRKPLTFRFGGASPPAWRPQIEQTVYVIAAAALDAPEARRGELMGQLIATCAECHTARTGASRGP